MRVVAGVARGRRLQAPAGLATRPTSDRVREAVFSSLVSWGGVDGAVVVDLFAGSGALGIEALSRGAARATFVESDRQALATIRHNLAAVRLDGPQAVVVSADALAVAGTPAVAIGTDIVLADPPYRFEEWPALLRRLASGGFTGLVVAESGASVCAPDGWATVKAKAYGSTVVTMLRPLHPHLPGASPP